jgi:PilZ domain
MQSDAVSSGVSATTSIQSGERRKSPRFDMHFSAFVRALGDPWSVSETTGVSAAGSSFVTDRPFLLNAPVEYVLTFPPDLTKAAQPLRVRFFGTVIRCERSAEGRGTFGIAVHNTAHRYLTQQEGADFEAMERRLQPNTNSTVSSEPRKAG